MAQREIPTQTEIIACDICLKEIPASEARSVEASDYVQHFCGLDCYATWRKQNPDENSGS